MTRLVALIAFAWLALVAWWLATAPRRNLPDPCSEPEDGLPPFDPWLEQQLYDRGLVRLLEAVQRGETR